MKKCGNGGKTRFFLTTNLRGLKRTILENAGAQEQKKEKREPRLWCREKQESCKLRVES